MAQNDKVCDLLLKYVEEKIPIYTCFSLYEFLLFKDTTSISISAPLLKEKRIAAHANLEMSRTVMQLQ